MSRFIFAALVFVAVCVVSGALGGALTSAFGVFGSLLGVFVGACLGWGAGTLATLIVGDDHYW